MDQAHGHMKRNVTQNPQNDYAETEVKQHQELPSS